MKEDGSLYGTGDKLKNTKLAETLEKIKANPDDFYNGTLANEIVGDIKDAGGIVQLADLKNYEVKERKPVETVVKGMKIYSMPPPGSGSLVEMTMNILQGNWKFIFSDLDVAIGSLNDQTIFLSIIYDGDISRIAKPLTTNVPIIWKPVS